MTSKDINTAVGTYSTAISDDAAAQKKPPKEGSNRGHEVHKHARANIGDTISGRPPKSHSDHVDDGFPDNRRPRDGEIGTGAAEDGEQGSAGAADEEATKFKRSI